MTTLETKNHGPYFGLKVIDLSQGIAGPYCGRMLSQYGADVIKVEPPSGDWIRVMGRSKESMSALFIANNLGKRSISIDLSKDEGRQIAIEMLSSADILIENFRPSVMKRLGLSYADVSKVNPNIIYLSITGFGSSGPYAHKPATDSIMQAITGMAVANRGHAGEPQRVGIYIPDTISALYSMISIGTALYERDRLPEQEAGGRHIEISLAECCAALQGGHILNDILFSGEYEVPISTPSGIFKTLDGHIMLATLGDDMWLRLCSALEKEDWTRSDLFGTRESRGKHANELNTALSELTSQYTSADLLDRLEAQDVLHAPVQDYGEFIQHEQTKHMSYFSELCQAPYGKVPFPRHPGCTASDNANLVAPYIGQHSEDILREYGYTSNAIRKMIDAGGLIQK